MIRRMIDHDPIKRMTAEEVLYHPTFYNDQKKLNFLLKVHECVKNMDWKSPSTNKKLNELHHYDSGLLNDGDVGNPRKFQLCEEIVFSEHKYFYKANDITKNVENKKKKKWILLKDITNVNALLKALRDKVAHAYDGPGNVPFQFAKDFDVTEDSYNPGKFLEVFLSQSPQLLVHLYELYRNTKMAVEFYPAAKQKL